MLRKRRTGEDKMGTLMFDLSSDMSMAVLFEINEAVSSVTRVEGGRDTKMSQGGVIMFFDLTEEESDRICAMLERRLSKDTFAWLNPTYDDFDDEEEE